MSFHDFKEACEKKGVVAIDKGGGHWQAKGKLLVNFWPASKRRTAHVAGTTQTLEGAGYNAVIRLALSPPPVVPKYGRTERKRAGGGRYYKAMKARRLADDPRCFWCKCGLNAETATIEHKVPLARGGTNGWDNLVIACRSCNEKRGHDMPEIAKAEVRS